ncbi:hypothetical protein [Bizionia sp. M204]|uniref:hypothetical protein n=1 Tax=Bizionia sp. M204 TaxID=2675331 RepID=UPI0020645112|nr:hypothetical protein [Bizionia sp. M204]UPS91396.1 hypothetical protein GMA17_06510 [Bizionia sp. M204]
MKQKELNTFEHLDNIMNTIQDLIDVKQDFTGFVMCCLAIEFLGSFSDEKTFDESNSTNRFKNGLDHFKNSKYNMHKNLLYKELRGGLVHQLRPLETLFLTSHSVHNANKEDHLSTNKESKVIIVLEQLFEDLKDAIKKFKNKLKKPNHSFDRKKIEAKHIIITEINIPDSESDAYFGTGHTLTNRTKII